MVFLVTKDDDLSMLITRLRDASTHTAFHVIGTVHNLIQGKLTAKVFTDKWPNFSAVVCQIIAAINEVGLVFCYATSDIALVSVLEASGLICEGSLIGLPKNHTDHVLETFTELKVCFEATPYYLPGCSNLNGDERLCLSGFTVGQLTPSQENLAVISSHWKYLKDAGPKKASFLKGLLENGHSCGIYTASGDERTLVAWAVQYPHGEIGHVFTLPEYRRRGFASVVVREQCKATLADGMTPVVMIEKGNSVPLSLFAKLGFVESGYKFNFINFSGTL